MAGIALLALGTLAGVAGASGSTTNVSFVALTPAKVVLSNVSIATKKTSSPVVIGGSTTVPTDATTVEVRVSAKAAASGSINVYPALNPTGGSGQKLVYSGSNQLATTTVEENVGQGNELTFYNAGSGTATVSAAIIGYSTQITSGDVSPANGRNGQVLTNTGTGAIWQSLPTPAEPSAGNFDATGGTAGQVLTNTGSGAAWQTPSAAALGYQEVTGSSTTVAPNSIARVAVYCPPPQVPVGSGVSGDNLGLIIDDSFPFYAGGVNFFNGWNFVVDNTSPVNQTFAPIVLCINP